MLIRAKLILFLVFVVIAMGLRISAYPQSKAIDSLRHLADRQKDDTQKVKLLNLLCDSLILYNDYENALSFAKEANSISEKISYPKGRCESHFWMGNTYRNLYNVDSALKHYYIALHIAAENKDRKREGEIYIKIAWMHAKGSYTKAIEDFEVAVKIGLQINDSLLVATANWGIAENYSALGNFDKAIAYSYKSLRVMDALNNDFMIARLYSCLGYIFSKQDQLDEAYKAYSLSLRYANKSGDEYLTSYALSSIGELYFAEKKYDKALEKFNLAMITYQKMKERYSIADIYQRFGMILEKKGDVMVDSGLTKQAKVFYMDALINFDSALVINKETDLKIGIAASLNSMAAICIKLNEKEKAKKYLTEALSYSKSIGTKLEIRDAYLNATTFNVNNKDYKSAFENYSNYIIYRDSLINEENTKKTVQTQMQYAFDKKEATLKAEQDKKDAIAKQKVLRQRNVRNFTFAGLACALAFLFVVNRQRNKIAKEKQRSDNLLLNILPVETAEELKNTGEAKAKSYEQVTVLFTDFKNFTQASEILSAEDLVKEINFCFSEFDKIVTKYGVEKIKTIGDAYMCAGGLPVTNLTHPIDVVNAALEMQAFILKTIEERKRNNEIFFELRLGIHTGPVIAGIVGTKKFAYDIWGDTVNTASRMESSGETGKVNISGTTYEMVKDKFECTYRGKVDAKNKGQIDMYFVENKM